MINLQSQILAKELNWYKFIDQSLRSFRIKNKNKNKIYRYNFNFFNIDMYKWKKTRNCAMKLGISLGEEVEKEPILLYKKPRIIQFTLYSSELEEPDGVDLRKLVAENYFLQKFIIEQLIGTIPSYNESTYKINFA
ncbi:hypothetical protein BpHYR1_050986 [Brachionus plicatilis]|uniref:Uncharacterized protein n=1 Tax=Brachionus plicatilis TaxID=10195 RepID=A0A3M7QY07_BRAPC|nr:hypothetical protein BpHYR1_050986 [Brachionus plicatilis]